MTKLALSLLAANPLRLYEELELVNRYADILHLDVMDGHFVPNLALGVDLCKEACKASKVQINVHLMVTNPSFYINVFWSMGCKAFVWHVEVDIDHLELISKVKSLGMKAGLAISPDTQPLMIIPYIDKLDLVTVMGVKPGFAGQAFIENTTDKVKNVRSLHNKLIIEVDGGVGIQNSRGLVTAGADILVSGSSFFKSDNKEEFSQSIRKIRR